MRSPGSTPKSFAVPPGDRIATADPDVLAVAKAEALESVALPEQG